MKGNIPTLDKVLEAARSPDKNITTLLKLHSLRTNISTAVDDAWTQERAVAELAGLKEDLSSKLSGWRDDKHQRFGPEAEGTLGAWNGQLLRLPHQLGNDRDEKGSRLSRPCSVTVSMFFTFLLMMKGSGDIPV